MHDKEHSGKKQDPKPPKTPDPTPAPVQHPKPGDDLPPSPPTGGHGDSEDDGN